jgi:cysteine desulfurase
MQDMKKEIYLDHAATTRMWPEVKEAMEPYLSEKYGNASTSYDLGKEAKAAMERAREKIAAAIGASPKEIYFTSGGSESDNWAIKSIAGSRKEKGMHIITSKIEHHAVLNSCEYLESLGYEVTYLDVDSYGLVDPEQLLRAIRPDTTLVTIMYANNEIGTIEPIREIGNIARRHQVIFHTDAVQAVGQIPLSVRQLPVDFLSASAHKFHGPKGVGFLYAREHVSLPSFIHGGSQESGKRAGTENVAGIVGMAEALSLCSARLRESMQHTQRLRDYFAERILRECEGARLNGHPSRRLPGNVNVSFSGVDASALLVLLEEDGIRAAAGSACSTGAAEVSHVLRAIGVPEEYASGSIRFTLGAENTKEEIDRTIRLLKDDVALLRQA